MKRISGICCLLFFISKFSVAQPPRDTAWGSWPHQEYYNNILSAPVVTGETHPISITPTGQKLCFDKRVMIKSILSSGPVEQCMYINTKDGYTAILPPRRGAASCDIKLDDPDFTMFVIGLKGNAYTFRNNKKNGVIEHWVSTGNTQVHQVSLGTMPGVFTLQKKSERRGYNGDKIKTWAYKYDNPSSPVYYLFGKNFPDAVDVSSAAYIGCFGVGYQYTDKGLFIIMEMESGSYGCKITALEDVDLCFDPAPFKIAENEFHTKFTASLQRQREKIAVEEIKAGSGDCSSQKMALVNFKKEQLQIQEARLYTSQQGNAYEDIEVQKAMGEMFDHVAMTQEAILESHVKICNAQSSMAKSRTQTSRQNYQDKINCLHSQIGQWQTLKEELKAIETRNADQPGKALAEKSKAFMRGLPSACN